MARASHSNRIRYVATLVAIAWVLHVFLYLVEQRTGVAFRYLFPLIHGGVAVLLFRRMTSPGYRGGALYGIIIVLSLTQAFSQLIFTTHAHYYPSDTLVIPWWTQWLLNRLFEAKILIINLIAGLRLLRNHRRAFYDRLVHRVPLPPRDEARFEQGNMSIVDAMFRYYIARAFPEIQKSRKSKSQNKPDKARHD